MHNFEREKRMSNFSFRLQFSCSSRGFFFFSVVPKVTSLALVSQIFNIFFPFSLDQSHFIRETLTIYNMILANSVVITQTSMKHMLAYSSINQIGYLIIKIIARDYNGYASMTVYLLFCTFRNLRTFACIILFSLCIGIDNIQDYGGLFIKDHLLTFSFALCLITLGSIPPLSGFFGKLYLFWCGWEASLYLLVFVGFFTSIISIYYYLKIVKLLITKEIEEMTTYI
jgi:NADH:ubiquinone oxidoreductase subunit 2 (subunit N)